jgi:hypothetical protein
MPQFEVGGRSADTVNRLCKATAYVVDIKGGQSFGEQQAEWMRRNTQLSMTIRWNTSRSKLGNFRLMAKRIR